jgi:hypothetical protein
MDRVQWWEFCEEGNEPLGIIKLSSLNFQLLKKYPAGVELLNPKDAEYSYLCIYYIL